MPAIEFLDEVEGILLNLISHSLGIAEIENRIFTAAKHRALIERREKARPVAGGPGLHRSIAHDDESRQVLILSTQPVGNPGPQGRPSGKLRPGVAQVDRRSVIEDVAVATANYADVVGAAANVGEQIRDEEPAPAARLE